MSQGYPPNPFGEPTGASPNPYSSPQFYQARLQGPPLIESVKWRVRPPAIFLCVCGGLGMLVSMVSAILAVALHDPRAAIDPNNSMADLQEFTGPDAAAIQILFVFVNLTIIVGASQMLRIKIRPMGFVAAILAMINCGNGCCLIGLPAAIWAIVILCQSDVVRAFDENY
jgi:hypothetical protein